MVFLDNYKVFYNFTKGVVEEKYLYLSNKKVGLLCTLQVSSCRDTLNR